MTSVYAGRLSTGKFAPRDANGAPIPNAEFFLYQPGTTTPIVYYADRNKSSTVGGPPRTDDRGNIDDAVKWAEPGFCDYWYGGEIIETNMEIEEDNGEDDVALATAISNIDDTLTGYYTKSEIDTIIAGTGAVTGAELQANKGAANGYAPLNSSSVVPNANLPTTATTSTRTPSAHAASHITGGSDPITPGKLIGTHFVDHPTLPYTASYGDLVLVDPQGDINDVVTLPTPAADKAPITILLSAETLEDPVISIVFGENTGTLASSIVSSPTWLGASITFTSTASSFYVTALPTNNQYSESQFGFSGKLIPTVPVTGTSPGSTVGQANSLTRLVFSNSSPNTCPLDPTAPVGTEVEIVRAQGAGKVTYSCASPGSVFDPDGYSATGVAGSRVSLCVISNPDGLSAVWLSGGRTGA